MAFVASQLIQEVTAHAQSDSLEDSRDFCADGTYFPNNLRKRAEMGKTRWQRVETYYFAGNATY